MGIDIVMLASLGTLACIIVMFLYLLNHMKKHIQEDIKKHPMP